MVFFFHAMDKLIALLSKVRPVFLQKKLFLIVFYGYSYINRCKLVLFQLLLPVIVVKGKVKDSNKFIQFLFIGREEFPLFFVDLIFDEEPDIKRVGSVFVWQLNRLDRFSFDGDAILVSVDRFYKRWLHKNDLLVFPHLVDMVLDVSGSLDDFVKQLSTSAKADVRKVRKKDFSYDVYSDLKLLRFFYDSMYLPLIKSRFADKPMFTPPFSFFIILHKIGYQLLLVKDKKDNFVSGCYFIPRDKEVFSRYNGVLNGNYDLIRNGAESAFYYFLIDWTKKQGFNTVDFGQSRPFKTDGVFRYKQKWGSQIRHDSGFDTPLVFGLKILRIDSVLQDFFEKNPFFSLDEQNNFVEYFKK